MFRASFKAPGWNSCGSKTSARSLGQAAERLATCMRAHPALRDIRTNKVLTPAQVRAKVLYADPKCVIVTGSDFKPNGAQVDIQPWAGKSRIVTRLQFNEAGTRQFADFTRKH